MRFNKIVSNFLSQIYGKNLILYKKEVQTWSYKTVEINCILYLLSHNCIPYWHWQETVYIVCPRTCLNQQEKSYYHSSRGKTIEENSRFLKKKFGQTFLKQEEHVLNYTLFSICQLHSKTNAILTQSHKLPCVSTQLQIKLSARLKKTL